METKGCKGLINALTHLQKHPKPLKKSPQIRFTPAIPILPRHLPKLLRLKREIHINRRRKKYKGPLNVGNVWRPDHNTTCHAIRDDFVPRFDPVNHTREPLRCSINREYSEDHREAWVILANLTHCREEINVGERTVAIDIGGVYTHAAQSVRHMTGVDRPRDRCVGEIDGSTRR